MRKVMLLVVAAAAFGLTGYAPMLGPVGGAMLLIGLGISLALSASGSVSSFAVGTGAVAAFAAGVLRPHSPVVAAAVFLACCYAERTWRVRGNDKRALHIGLGLGGGALAGAVVSQVAHAQWSVAAVGAVVCAVLAALPQLVEADDTLAASLDGIADDVAEPAATHLREGARLRRTIDDAVLDRKQTKQARQTWRSLQKLARARRRLQKVRSAQAPSRAAVSGTPPHTGAAAAAAATATARCSDGAEKPPKRTATPRADTDHGSAVVRRVDERIADHVQALARMYTAADAAKAAEMSLEDGPLRSVENVGESLEQMSKAFVEDL